MSFIKKYINEVSILIEEIKTDPKLIYNRYCKVDALIGPVNSIDLIDEFLQAYYENPTQDFSKITSKYK